MTVEPGGYLLIFLTIFWCCQTGSAWPLLYVGGFLAVLFPLCLWVHRLNRKFDEDMLREFPHDPYIQKKYGRK